MVTQDYSCLLTVSYCFRLQEKRYSELVYVLPSSLSERDNFSAGRIDGKIVPCLSHSSELIAGRENNGSQVQNDC